MDNQIKMMAEFTHAPKFNTLPASIVQQLKIHLLDTLGSLLFSIREGTPQKVERSLTTLTGLSGPSFPLQLPATYAAQYYTTLIRYPDFMDNFLAKESTCHPSDNIGALLAAAHVKEIGGATFLSAMAVAYEMECRLVEQFPLMIKGYDHTALLAFSATAGLSRLLELSVEQTMNALSIAGCSYNPLVTSRASYTSQWKGLASSLVNAGCTSICMLTKEDITGPIQLFELPEKGYNAIYGIELKYDWQQDQLDLIPRCTLKRYNAEVHTQSAIAATLELKKKHDINPAQIKSIEVTTFLTAFHIVGGGEYGKRTLVYSKEQADHSMAYLIAVALLDGDVQPAQLTPDRITRDDVQTLLQKVNIHTGFPLHKPVKMAGLLDPYTAAYPDKLKSSVAIRMEDGTIFKAEKEQFKGFFTDPFNWEDAIEKFRQLTGNNIKQDTGEQVIAAVQKLEKTTVNQLLRLIFPSA